MWENSLSYGAVSAAFDIRDQGAVRKWISCYLSGGFDALTPRPPHRPKNMSDLNPKQTETAADNASLTREELVKKVKRLEMELAILKKFEALDQAKRAATKKKRK
ncbi:Helix-turn-helix domain-containing protein [Massilia sp. CF038]|nr:Helix-turn-helix domain-containing protein [Massilia sp. CF038]